MLELIWIVFVIIACANLFFAPRLKAKKLVSIDLVSIVIPMRNEENNAREVIEDVLAQTYTSIEVLIVNDGSTDKTAEILATYGSNSKIKVFDIVKKDERWLGKSYAVNYALARAQGHTIITIDADVRLDKSAVAALLAEKSVGKADLLTCFPLQTMKTFGETLTVPLMTWSHIGFVPIPLVNNMRNENVSLANGQVLVMDKALYQKLGGYSQIKDRLNDDIALVRLVKGAGYKVRVVLGDKLVSCRMYEGYSSAKNGYGRTILINMLNKELGLLLLLILILLNLLPFVFVFFDSRLLFTCGLIITHRVLTSLSYRQNVLVNIVLHPLQMLALVDIIFVSYYKAKQSQVEWRGRKINT
jgi:chlorobactene glucosyltransferase